VHQPARTGLCTRLPSTSDNFTLSTGKLKTKCQLTHAPPTAAHRNAWRSSTHKPPAQLQGVWRSKVTHSMTTQHACLTKQRNASHHISQHVAAHHITPQHVHHTRAQHSTAQRSAAKHTTVRLNPLNTTTYRMYTLHASLAAHSSAQKFYTKVPYNFCSHRVHWVVC
jgi:hypothetical protein